MPPSTLLYLLKRLFASGDGGSRHLTATVWAAGLTVLSLLVASAVIVPIEASAPRATITTFPRAVWWSVETATTVGYGDFFPVTAWGRVIATVLMLVGITAFTIVTAALATWFVSSAQRDMRKIVTEAARLEHRGKTAASFEVRALHRRFDRMERLLAGPGTAGPEGG